MMGLCRVCDCPLKEKDSVFVYVQDEEAFFRVHCPFCGAVYFAKANGDVVRLPAMN